MAESKCGGACKCSCKAEIANLKEIVGVLSGLLKDADDVLEVVENDDMFDEAADADNLELLRGRIESVLGQLVSAKLDGRVPVFVAEGSAL